VKYVPEFEEALGLFEVGQPAQKHGTLFEQVESIVEEEVIDPGTADPPLEGAEALPAPLERQLGAEMGAQVVKLHRDHGVDVRVGVGVAALEGSGRVERVQLANAQ
jgi:hypothetical protein